MRGTLALVFLGLVACGPSRGRGPFDLGARADLAGQDLAGADLADEDLTGADLAGADLTSPYPLYAGPLTLSTKAQIDWDGNIFDGPVKAAHFVDGFGTVTFKGQVLPAVVYQKIPFGVYTLAAIVAMTSDNMLLTYAYCKNGGITAFYYESLVDDVTVDSSLSNPGTCSFIDAPSPGMVSFTQPGPLTYGPPRDHADIDGPRISLHGGTGTLLFGTESYDLHVFATVDCTATLCGGMGWYELHTSLRRGDAFAIAILYLNPAMKDMVQISFGFRFDQPSMWPKDELVPATWTTK